MVDTTKQRADQSFFVFVKDTNTGKIRRIAIPSDVQIGLKDNPAELQLLGRLSLSATSYNVTVVNQGMLSVSNNDTVVSVSLTDVPASGRIRVNLPTNPRDGQLHFIKDVSGTASTVPIDVTPGGGTAIDQLGSQSLIDSYASLVVYWSDGSWHVLSAGVGGAPMGSSYVTVGAEPGLTAERVLTAGNDVGLTDAGAGSTLTINVDYSNNYTTYASRGVARKGRTVYLTNSPAAMWVSDGSLWRPIINGTLGDEPPLAATFTGFNTGTSDLTQLNGALQLDGQSDATATARGYVVSNVNATAYVEATLSMMPVGNSTAGAFSEAGLVFRESATNKLFTFVSVIDHNNHLAFLQTGIWTNSTTQTSTNTYAMPLDGNNALWMRLRRTSTQCFAEVSRDRIYWSTWETQTLTTPFTTAPNQVGLVAIGLNVVPTAIVTSFHQAS